MFTFSHLHAVHFYPFSIFSSILYLSFILSASFHAEHVTDMIDCRDPNLQQTLDRFAASAVWAASGEFTDRDIDEAKLSVFSQVAITVPIVLRTRVMGLHCGESCMILITITSSVFD